MIPSIMLPVKFGNMTQQNLILQLLQEKGSQGLNSYDADYLYHVKQAPTRIWEIKKSGHTIITKTNPNKSVNWILTHSPRVKPPKVPHNTEYIFVGNKAIPKEEPRQEVLI